MYYNLSQNAIELSNNQSITLFEYEPWQKIVFSIFIFPIIFFSIAGNTLVIIAISKYSYLKTTHNIFLASLAIADLAVAITAMTLNALQLLSGHWYLKAFMCRMWFTCDVLFSTASILNLFCVSIDCYLSISNRYSYSYTAEHPTKSRRVRIMISMVWLISLLISSVPIFTGIYTTKEHAAEINNLDYMNGLCIFNVNVPYRVISSIVSFWLPATGMIIFYMLVMQKATKIEEAKSQMYNSIHSHDADKGSVALKKLWRREYKALKTLGTVIGLFVLCWIFFFFRMTFCWTESFICTESILHNQILEDILFWIGYSSSMINPFLYNFTNQEFRKAFRSLLKIQSKNFNSPKKKPITPIS